MNHTDSPRWLALLVLLGCSSTRPTNDGPVSGTFDGAHFDVSGGYAETRDGVIYVTLANVTASCTALLQPAPNLQRVDITLPSATQAPGEYALGSSTTAPHMAVTSFGSDLHQASRVLESGSVSVTQIDASQVTGALSVSENGVVLSGTFSEPLCSQ